MARRSNNRRSSAPAPSRTQSRPATTSAASSTRPSVPATAPPPAAQQVQPAMVQGQQPSLFGQMASTAAGVAVGHSVGHAITGMFSGGGGSSSSSAAPEQQAAAAPQQYPAGSAPVYNACELDQRAFMKCLEQNNNDIASCQMFYDLYKQCMQNNAANSQRSFY